MKKVILNQKSYLFYDEMVKFKSEFDKLKPNNYEFIIFPPILYLSLFKDSKYSVGTQNFFSYKTGSFTGEINLESLKKMNINYTFVGHYERRKIIGETYMTFKEKLFKSLNSKCNTILFVGEQKKTRRPFNYIKKELNYYLRNNDSQNETVIEYNNQLKRLEQVYKNMDKVNSLKDTDSLLLQNAIQATRKRVRMGQISKTFSDIKNRLNRKNEKNIEK